MSNDYLTDVNGEIYSTPNIKQIRRELEANTHLWHHVLYEHEGGVPEPVPFVDDRGIFNLYILVAGHPSGELMSLACAWHPNNLNWLDVFEKSEFLCNMVPSAVLYSHAVLMVTWVCK
jgi:hypothetical protein